MLNVVQQEQCVMSETIAFGTTVSLGLDGELIVQLDARGEKHMCSTLFGRGEEILQFLRQDAPTLEAELLFEGEGLVRISGSDEDVATALPKVQLLVDSMKQDLAHKLAKIHERIAAEARSAQVEQAQRERLGLVTMVPPKSEFRVPHTSADVRSETARLEVGRQVAAARKREPIAYAPAVQCMKGSASQVQTSKQWHTPKSLVKQYAKNASILEEAPVPHKLSVFDRNRLAQCAAMGEEFVEVLPGRCWVIPYALSFEECDEMCRAAEEHGLQPVSEHSTGRQNARTRNFYDAKTCELVWSRLPASFLAEVARTSPCNGVRSVMESWRVSKYVPGQFFRPHYDESYTRGCCVDGVGVSNEHGEHGEVSSHTVLVILTESYEGGATRFWPTDHYDEALDVIGLKGSVLVFEQLTLLHEGCPLVSGQKIVAQGSLMREPVAAISKSTPTFSTGFRYGPGAQS